jgi:hypothetical protein
MQRDAIHPLLLCSATNTSFLDRTLAGEHSANHRLRKTTAKEESGPTGVLTPPPGLGYRRLFAA